MIEMLGVLAIIGVLSAGGIWGYNVAMTKHKVSSFIEDIEITMANINYLKGNKIHFGTSGLQADKLLQAGVIPQKYAKTLYKSGTKFYIKDALNQAGFIVARSGRLSSPAEEELGDGRTLIHKAGELFRVAFQTKLDKTTCAQVTKHNFGQHKDYIVRINTVDNYSYLFPLSPAQSEDFCSKVEENDGYTQILFLYNAEIR